MTTEFKRPAVEQFIKEEKLSDTTDGVIYDLCMYILQLEQASAANSQRSEKPVVSDDVLMEARDEAERLCESPELKCNPVAQTAFGDGYVVGKMAGFRKASELNALARMPTKEEIDQATQDWLGQKMKDIVAIANHYSFLRGQEFKEGALWLRDKVLGK